MGLFSKKPTVSPEAEKICAAITEAKCIVPEGYGYTSIDGRFCISAHSSFVEIYLFVKGAGSSGRTTYKAAALNRKEDVQAINEVLAARIAEIATSWAGPE